MLKGQTAVVLGGTGNVGTGAAFGYLKEGATVIITSRSEERGLATVAQLESLDESFKGRIHSVAASWGSKEDAQVALEQVMKKCGDSGYQHVLCNLGFGKVEKDDPLDSSQEALVGLLAAGGYFANVVASGAFLPHVLKQEGASLALVSGGFAHGAPTPYWMAELKNAALNTWGSILASRTKEDAVRTNVVCIHFGVAKFGESQNQLGVQGVDSRQLGSYFARLAAGKEAKKGDTQCLESIDEFLKVKF